MKVYVDPVCDIHYSSFYILGLQQCFGKKNIKFSSKYFKNFRHNNHFFAFVIEEGSTFKNYIIDFTDSSIIDQNALDWSHRYGKVNFKLGSNPSKKIVVIGPSFGINIFDFLTTLFLAGSNFVKSFRRIGNKRRFLADYRSQLRRPTYKEYEHLESRDNYVFFMGSLWKKESNTNKFRANFIKACRDNNEIVFEGGFAPRTKNDIKGFEELTVIERIPMKEYLLKTKKSMLVFNTPAVKDCHGWKLAEYLCLGKAIISTPLSREMPGDLSIQDEILTCDGSLEDIENKINIILSNAKEKLRLEEASKSYFQEHLAPKKVVKKLISN